MAATGPRHVELSITWQWVSPALASVGAKDVAVLRDGVETRVPIGQLRVGERFLVRPGERIATDGLVVEGNSLWTARR